MSFTAQIWASLISVAKIATAGYRVLFKGPWCGIYNADNEVIGQLAARNGLYHVEHDITVMSGNIEPKEVVTLKELHHWMGHVTPMAMKHMLDDGAIDRVELDGSSTLSSCKSCKYARMTQRPIKHTWVEPRVSAFGKEIHSNMWGKSPVMMPGHKEYYVSFKDDYSHWTHLKLLATKDETFKAYQDFEVWANTQHGTKIMRLQSDQGGEYLDGEFSKHLRRNGTIRLLTTHNTPEYNRVWEWLNWTLLECTHTLLHASKLPKNLWGEAINHVIWLKNRTMTKALPNGKTLFEMVYGRKPDLGILKEWGCWVWVHDKSGLKLDGRSWVRWWVGYDSESMGAHCIYWGHGRVSVECDVKFSNDDIPILNAVMFEGEKGLNKWEIVQNQSPDNIDETNKDSPKSESPNNNPPQQPKIQQNFSPADEWLGKPFNRTVYSLVATRE